MPYNNFVPNIHLMTQYQLEIVTPLGTVLSELTEDRTEIEKVVSELPTSTLIDMRTEEGHTVHMTRGMIDQSVFFIRTV